MAGYPKNAQSSSSQKLWSILDILERVTLVHNALPGLFTLGGRQSKVHLPHMSDQIDVPTGLHRTARPFAAVRSHPTMGHFVLLKLIGVVVRLVTAFHRALEPWLSGCAEMHRLVVYIHWLQCGGGEVAPQLAAPVFALYVNATHVTV